MASRDLRKRSKAPGDDQTYREAERLFFETVTNRGLDQRRYVVESQPKDLLDVFATKEAGGRLGMQPDFSITSKRTKRKLFVEVKKQGNRGNADERACRQYTTTFITLMQDRFDYDYHPFVTIFCEALATNRRYTEKFKGLIPKEHYFLWADYQEKAPLKKFLRGRCHAWLD